MNDASDVKWNSANWSVLDICLKQCDLWAWFNVRNDNVNSNAAVLFTKFSHHPTACAAIKTGFRKQNRRIDYGRLTRWRWHIDYVGRFNSNARLLKAILNSFERRLKF